MMNKRILCLLLCAMLLTGCTSVQSNVQTTAPTLPPAEAKYDAPVGDEGLLHTATAALYLPSTDGQRLLTRYTTLSLDHAQHSAEALVQALLAQSVTNETQSLGNGVTLSLYGASPVEVSCGICNVNLAATALQLEQEELYRVCAAMAATLCELDDIQYVNFLVADQAVSMDITGSLPLGSQTAHPGEELTVLWEQITARRAPLGENPANTPVSAVATLYFPLADRSGVAAETRTLTFAGQSADQLAEGLLTALSAGAQYLPGVNAMPNLSGLMTQQPQAVDLEDGGRMLNLYFHAGLENSLKQVDLDMPCFISSLVYTLTSFIPSLAYVRIYVGDAPLTSLYSTTHGNLIFQNGLILRQQFSAFLQSQVTLYFSTGSKLKEVHRSLRPSQSQSPRALLAALLAGPIQQELNAGFAPILPTGLTEDDILGLSLVGDTLLVNLSARCSEFIRALTADQEQLACYAMVNTLGKATGAARVRFFFDGQVVESLGSALYWAGEFLVNPGLIDQTLGSFPTTWNVHKKTASVHNMFTPRTKSLRILCS